MSYDLYFVRRDPGQSFEDALDAVERSLERDPQPLTGSDLELWDDLVGVTREVLGDVEVFDDELNTRELRHRPSGIQLSIFNGEVSLHVRSRSAVDDSTDVDALVTELAKAIERATGLEGYDTQRETPISGDGDGAPGRNESSTAAAWDEDGRESDGTSTSLPVIRAKTLTSARASGEGAPTGPDDRHWWEFWKR